MKMNHLLLEVYCDRDKNKKEVVCKKINYKIGFHCIESRCPYFSYAKCPNEIAYVNEEGVTENEHCFIGFGGEMDTENNKKRIKLIEKWKGICLEKIDEAYKTYMDEKNYE